MRSSLAVSKMGAQCRPSLVGGRQIVPFVDGNFEHTGAFKNIDDGSDCCFVGDGILTVGCDAAHLDDVGPEVFNWSIWRPFVG